MSFCGESQSGRLGRLCIQVVSTPIFFAFGGDGECFLWIVVHPGKVAGSVKVLAARDDAYSRWRLEGRKLWLIELAAVISYFETTGWLLTCLITFLERRYPDQFPEGEHSNRSYLPA